jgi:hypothetical protein
MHRTHKRQEGARNDGPREATEERTVRSALPGVSDEANRQLTSQLRAVIGTDRVRVPQSRAHIERTRPRRGSAWVNDERFLIHVVLPVAAVVTAIAALSTGTVWALCAGVFVLFVAVYNVVSFVFRLMAQSDEMSPTTTALLEEEGVQDPERLFSDLVNEFTEEGKP